MRHEADLCIQPVENKRGYDRTIVPTMMDLRFAKVVRPQAKFPLFNLLINHPLSSITLLHPPSPVRSFLQLF